MFLLSNYFLGVNTEIMKFHTESCTQNCSPSTFLEYLFTEFVPSRAFFCLVYTSQNMQLYCQYTHHFSEYTPIVLKYIFCTLEKIIRKVHREIHILVAFLIFSFQDTTIFLALHRSISPLRLHHKECARSSLLSGL